MASRKKKDAIEVCFPSSVGDLFLFTTRFSAPYAAWVDCFAVLQGLSDRVSAARHLLRCASELTGRRR
jgi:hypothetical protein